MRDFPRQALWCFDKGLSGVHCLLLSFALLHEGHKQAQCYVDSMQEDPTEYQIC